MSYSIKTKNITKNMGCFLSQFKWTFFATLTTPNPMTSKQGRRYMENYHKHLLELGLKPIIYWVVEPFFDKENGYHIHALIKIDVFDDIKTLLDALKKAWRQISGGSAISSKTTQIDPYIEEKGANYYVAKYICNKNAEYDVFV
jgi:hypothetical protein